MSVAIDRALAMATRHGASHVLVAFDLDGTLLRGTVREPDLDALKDSDPARFRQVERTVTYLEALRPTEAGLAAQLDRLAAAGIPAYLLTARGPDMRDMTQRELDANGLRLSPGPDCGPPLCLDRNGIDPDQVVRAARDALGPTTLARLGFERGRRITVSDNIVMAAGLDKGVILRTLGRSLGTPIRGYVFVDDQARNVADVAQAATGMAEEVAVFHYSSPEPEQRGSQAEADTRWRRAEQAICEALSPRWCPPH